MASKRALVVDDSSTARQALARLLEQHQILVDFAHSGEEALEFLKHQLVDVIFMDHTMPGMDGLEAVSAIKGNPRTATIPVMMYTTKEGEVYVGQARALGAIGVLPKQVQPGVLFDMLLKLDLVEDRRSSDAPPRADAPRRRFTDLVDDVDREYDNRARGASIQALMTRLLEEQHVKLRAELLAGQRRFAREVADELLRERASAASATGAVLPEPAASTPWPVIAAALGMMALALAAWAWQLRLDRDAALLDAARLDTASRNEVMSLVEQKDDLTTTMSAQSRRSEAQRQAAIDALEWAMNQGGRIAFDEVPFNDALASRLSVLAERLGELAFHGEVVLTAQLGAFCLMRDEFGSLRPAPDDLPAADCEQIGHPLDDTGSLGALQTIGFADEIDALQKHTPGVRFALHSAWGGDRNAPSGTARAGDWNRAAATNHRITYAFLPMGAAGA
jgi:CheY-like chemotaxis protein